MRDETKRRKARVKNLIDKGILGNNSAELTLLVGEKTK